MATDARSVRSTRSGRAPRAASRPSRSCWPAPPGPARPPATASRCWPSTISPASAATAGSSESRIPKTLAASRRSASSSREYGSREDSTASPRPFTTCSVVQMSALLRPGRQHHERGDHQGDGQAVELRELGAGAPAEQDVRRPQRTGRRRQQQTHPAELVERHRERLGDQQHPSPGGGDRDEVERRRDSTVGQHQRAEELHGDRDTQREVGQRAVEAPVHQPERHPERHHGQPRLARVAPPARSGQWHAGSAPRTGSAAAPTRPPRSPGPGWPPVPRRTAPTPRHRRPAAARGHETRPPP